MKKCALLCILILLMQLWSIAVADGGNTVLWRDIVDGSYRNQNVSLTVQKSGNTYVIDGGAAGCVVSDICIDSRDAESSFGSGSYVFRNVTLDGDFFVVSHDKKAYSIRLEESVNASECFLELNSGYDAYGDESGITEYANGKLAAEIFCETRGIAAYPVHNSSFELKNYANTSSISMEVYDKSTVRIENHAEKMNSIFIQNDVQSDVYFENHADCISITAWAYSQSALEFVNRAKKVNLLATGAQYGAQVRFVNDAEITNTTPDPDRYDGNEFGDYAVVIDIDQDSRLEFTGNGSICAGTQIYDFYKPSKQIGPVGGASVVYHIHELELQDDRAANIQTIEQIAKNVDFDWSQVRKREGAEQIVAYYRDEEATQNSYVVPIVAEKESGTIVDGENEFEQSAPVEIPTLIVSEKADGDLFLKYDAKNNGKNTITYNLHLVDEMGQEISLPAQCILCFPYPEGLDAQSGRKYRIIIHHYGDKKTEVFKSEDGEIEFTDQGLCITVDSFSPFVITWEEMKPSESLPKTGDDSSLMLYGALFIISSAMLLVMKKRAKQA